MNYYNEWDKHAAAWLRELIKAGSLTWKTWDMPQREPICALRASTRRTSDNDCSGWPTPQTVDAPSASLGES